MTQDDDDDDPNDNATNDRTTAPVSVVAMEPQNEPDIPSQQQLLATTLNSLTVTTTTTTATRNNSLDDAPHVTSQTTTTTTTTEATTTAATTTDTTSSIATSPDPSSIPVTIVRSYTIDPYDMDTNITVQIFQERWVVTCSQTKQNDGKITAWLLCQPSSMNNMHSLRQQQQLQWEVSHLLGGGKRDDALLTVYCQRIATVFWERRLAAAGVTRNPAPPPTILFGWTLWNMPSGIHQNDLMHNNQTESSVMGGRHHEPELFHTMVDLVVHTMVDAVSIPS